MKKVGIITIHSIENFGSFCQAFALQEIVKSLFYDVEVIDYVYPNDYHKSQYAIVNPYARASVEKTLVARIRDYLYRHLFRAKNVRIRRGKYEDTIKQYLLLSVRYPSIESLKDCADKYDIYLTGSDQVWNPRYLFNDLSFLLDFTDNPNKIAFSSSFGSKVIGLEHSKLYSPYLSKYKFISTREESGVHLVKDICGKDAICTCDPSLLLSKEKWGNRLVCGKPLVSGKYLLCYVLTYTSNPYPYALEFINYIHRVTGLKIICIDNSSRFWMRLGYKGFQNCGPQDILNLFFNASFIVSSSFHGAAFSLIFRKDFYSILPPDVDDERQASLLNKVGANNRIIRVGDPLPSAHEVYINNWDELSSRLECYKTESLVYLEKALTVCSNDGIM